MKKISETIMAFLMILGLIAAVSLPIYLIISTACLKADLPQWFIIINIILSAFTILLIAFLFIASLFDKEKNSHE